MLDRVRSIKRISELVRDRSVHLFGMWYNVVGSAMKDDVPALIP